MEALGLDGAKIGIVVEHKFIPEEIDSYRTEFTKRGATVDLLTRLWYGDDKPVKNTFYSDIDPNDNKPTDTPKPLIVGRDITTVQPGDYAAVIMSANYTSVRLRFTGLKPLQELTETDIAAFDAQAHVREAPVVRFFAAAMSNKRVVKGFLCHGLWIVTPNPHLLRGRQVICHSVVMSDVINCSAQIKLTRNGVVVDDDIVTGFSKHEVLPFIDAIAEQVTARADP